MKRLFFIALCLTLIISAQKGVAQDTNALPIKDYFDAVALYETAKYKDARSIFERLLEKYPGEVSFYRYYWITIEVIDGDEPRNTAIKKALPILERVPVEQRNEVFYQSYLFGLYYVYDEDKYKSIVKEAAAKFPKSKLLAYYRYHLAEKEKDVIESVKILEKYIADYEDTNSRVADAAYDVLEKKIKNPTLFSRSDLRSLAAKIESLNLRRFENPHWIEKQKDYASYPWTMRKIADYLRNTYPEEGVKYAQKGLSFAIANRDKDPYMGTDITMLQESLLRSLVMLKRWGEAKNVGEALFKELQNPVETEINEAEVRRNYAIACEALGMVPKAREQFIFASMINPSFKNDLDSFNGKYRISPMSYRRFEAEVRKSFEQKSKFRDKINKEKLLKGLIKKKASDFVIKDLNGKTVTLKDYQGKTLFLGFWATWCEPCLKEFEEVKIAAKKYSSDPSIAFAFICDDEREGSKKLKEFVTKNGYEFPIFYGNTEVNTKYGVSSFPTLFIIDADGNIRFQHNGYVKDGYYLKKLDWMLEAIRK